MSEEAYIEGWRENDPLADIRRYRTEILLATHFGINNKKGVMSYTELEKLVIADLSKTYKFNPPASFVSKCMDYLLRTGQLQRDASNPDVIIKGPRW